LEAAPSREVTKEDFSSAVIGGESWIQDRC